MRSNPEFSPNANLTVSHKGGIGRRILLPLAGVTAAVALRIPGGVVHAQESSSLTSSVPISSEFLLKGSVTSDTLNQDLKPTKPDQCLAEFRKTESNGRIIIEDCHGNILKETPPIVSKNNLTPLNNLTPFDTFLEIAKSPLGILTELTGGAAGIGLIVKKLVHKKH